MNGPDGIMERMFKDALDEMASGAAGTNWRDIETNTLFLACFGMLYNHLIHKIVRPLWVFAGTVAAGVIAYIVISIITHGSPG